MVLPEDTGWLAQSGEQVGGGAGKKYPYFQLGDQGHRNITTEEAIAMAEQHITQGNLLSESDLGQLHSVGADITQFRDQFIPEQSRTYHQGNCPAACLWEAGACHCGDGAGANPAQVQANLAIDSILCPELWGQPGVTACDVSEEVVARNEQRIADQRAREAAAKAAEAAAKAAAQQSAQSSSATFSDFYSAPASKPVVVNKKPPVVHSFYEDIVSTVVPVVKVQAQPTKPIDYGMYESDFIKIKPVKKTKDVNVYSFMDW